jgi:hypothetical protein
MRILVCGDRNWNNRDFLYGYLSGITKDYYLGGITIIEGEARGADSMARDWAELFGINFELYPADWKLHGKAACPIRNRQMLNAKPDLVIAFHNNIEQSKGTKNMVSIARKAGIRVEVITE